MSYTAGVGGGLGPELLHLTVCANASLYYMTPTIVIMIAMIVLMMTVAMIHNDHLKKNDDRT